MRVKLCGEVTNNGWARIYRLFGFDVCCPADVQNALETCPQDEELVFEINSGGGSVYQGFEMYSAIRDWKGKTAAEVQGIAASAASVIMAACDRVTMSPVANVMIHRASTSASGNSAAMRQAKQMLDTIDESILNAYVEKAGGKTTRESFQRMMRNETFMTAQQAVDCGLADEVSGAGGSTAGLINSAVASADGGTHSEALPPIDDLLRIAAAAGVQVDAAALQGLPGLAAEPNGQSTAEPTACFEYNTPGGTSGGNEEDSSMEINTVDDLREAYPALVAQIEQTAANAATTAERQRIQEIEDMALPGSEEMTTKAKFTEPMSAADYAKAAMKRAKAQGESYLDAAKKDANDANAVNTEPASGNGQDEIMAAIKRNSKIKE
jgi:ATP-dependent protease ClpP protease subunit